MCTLHSLFSLNVKSAQMKNEKKCTVETLNTHRSTHCFSVNFLHKCTFQSQISVHFSALILPHFLGPVRLGDLRPAWDRARHAPREPHYFNSYAAQAAARRRCSGTARALLLQRPLACCCCSCCSRAAAAAAVRALLLQQQLASARAGIVPADRAAASC